MNNFGRFLALPILGAACLTLAACAYDAAGKPIPPTAAQIQGIACQGDAILQPLAADLAPAILAAVSPGSVGDARLAIQLDAPVHQVVQSACGANGVAGVVVNGTTVPVTVAPAAAKPPG